MNFTRLTQLIAGINQLITVFSTARSSYYEWSLSRYPAHTSKVDKKKPDVAKVQKDDISGNGKSDNKGHKNKNNAGNKSNSSNPNPPKASNKNRNKKNSKKNGQKKRRYRSTDASDALKSKYMWPLE